MYIRKKMWILKNTFGERNKIGNVVRRAGIITKQKVSSFSYWAMYVCLIKI